MLSYSAIFSSLVGTSWAGRLRSRAATSTITRPSRL
jgi:hypothetical protein